MCVGEGLEGTRCGVLGVRGSGSYDLARFIFGIGGRAAITQESDFPKNLTLRT